MDTIIKTKNINHPLDDVFDVVPGSTLVEFTEIVPDKLVEMPNYDSKDNELETQLQEIYTSAMNTAQVLDDEVEVVEGKYKARLGEVSATMLSVALSAVREKSLLKQHKDKLSTGKGPSTLNQTLNIFDRNEIIKLLQNKNQK